MCVIVFTSSGSPSVQTAMASIVVSSSSVRVETAGSSIWTYLQPASTSASTSFRRACASAMVRPLRSG
jgi:hypothetical protein